MRLILVVLCVIAFPMTLLGQTEKDLAGSVYSETWGECPESKMKFVFEIVVSKDGEITKVQLVEKPDSVSSEVVKKMEEQIRKRNLVGSQRMPKESTGKVTFCIGKNEE